MAWGRPPASGDWTRPADPDAAAAVVDYSQWIELKPANALSSADPNSVLTSNAWSESGWQFVVGKGTNTHRLPNAGAYWFFAALDNLGNTVTLGNPYTVEFKIKQPDPPADSSDIVVLVGISRGAFSNWVGNGFQQDGTAGPDMARTYYNGSTSNLSYATATTADSDGQVYIGPTQILYDVNDSVHYAYGPGFATWMRESNSPVGSDRQTRAKYGDSTKSMGAAAPTRLFLSIGEGGATDTFSIQVFYRIVPQYDNT